MSFKKTMLAIAAVTALTAATAVPAMALENEFHGMYRMFGFLTNAETGGGTFNLADESQNSFFAEQRARLMYTAKANDDLKLVTQFELDARFGGSNAGSTGKYQTNDAGGLDADQVTLETKNFYLDFKIPATPVNMKVGLQPFSDAYQGVFGAFDGTGVVASAKVGAFTPTLGWFRLADNMFTTGGTAFTTNNKTLPGDDTVDLYVVDGKFAINKDISVGASYYNVQNDIGVDTVSTGFGPLVDYQLLHQLGVNASAKVGPAALTGFLAYQFGDYSDTRDLSAFAAAAIAKVAVGPGTINASALYLSGQDADTTGDFNSFRQLATNGTVSYFNPSNMWLLIRNGAMINSSTAIGSTDLTKGNRGLMGIFGGYEMAMGKAFGSANIGYARVDEKRTAESSSIGTEINATIGYKLYDNLAASFTAAYLVLGDGADSADNFGGTLGATDADNPYMTNIQLSYLF